MRYLKLAVLSLMLGGVLMLSNTPGASAKTEACFDCPSAQQQGSQCCFLVGCSTLDNQCFYDNCQFGQCQEPFQVPCCF